MLATSHTVPEGLGNDELKAIVYEPLYEVACISVQLFSVYAQ